MEKTNAKVVTNLILRVTNELPIKDVCLPIIEEDDADDPKDHVVFGQLRDPNMAWAMAKKEKRAFDELPEGGQIMATAIVNAWTKVHLRPDLYGKDDDRRDGQTKIKGDREDE